MKKYFYLAISTAVVLTASYWGFRQFADNSGNDMFSENVEALSMKESKSFEYADGYPYTTTCGVRISKHKTCHTEIIVCQGGGNGCNSKDCPQHKSDDD